MRKMRLNLDQLAVESFDTDDGAGRVLGTVRANASDEGDVAITDPVAIPSLDCSRNPYTACDSCRLSCIDTCNQPTCDSCFITGCKANCA